MGFTTIAFTESNDSATLTEIAATVGEQHLNFSGDDIFTPSFAPNLIGYHFMGASFTQGRIQSPTLAKRLFIDVEPADLADEPSSPPAVHFFPTSEIPLKADDSIRALMAEDGAGATRVTALLFLSEGPLGSMRGPWYSARFTGTTTLTANQWTNGQIASAQQLPPGDYVVGGLRAQAAGLRAARIYFPGPQGVRPGASGTDADSDLDFELFRRGNLGPWGRFSSRVLPTVDYLSASADTAETLHLDLIVPE